MNIFKCSCVKNWEHMAPLFLRIVTGLIFLMHGLMKTADVSMFGGMLNASHFPAPHFFAWVAVILEIVGGVALILGFLTHWVSKFLMIEMVVALFLVHANHGFFVQNNGYEFVLLLVVATFSLMITGAGKWSVDEWLLRSCCGKCLGGKCDKHIKENPIK